MGLLQSKGRNTNVDDEISKAIQGRQKVTRLLLYGPGEAGKTTILRQMRLSKGNNLDEAMQFRGLICWNVVEGAGLTIEAGKFFFGKDFKGNEDAIIVEKYFQKFSKNKTNTTLDDKVLVDAILNIFQHDDFQYCLSRRNEYQIHDGWDYYIKRLKEWPSWGGPKWKPSGKDLLHSRTRTTGRDIVEFDLEGLKYHLIDVGGQKAERQKFLSMFAQMEAVIFVASLSDYDAMLFEDSTTNRLTDAIDMWERTINSKTFEKAFFLLFLNKKDVFQRKFYHEKRPIVPIGFTCDPPPLPEDEEDEECRNALKWYENLFLSKINLDSPKRNKVRVYQTTALNPQNIKEVMDVCTGLLVHNNVGAV